MLVQMEVISKIIIISYNKHYRSITIFVACENFDFSKQNCYTISMMAIRVWQLFFSLNFIFGLGNAQFNIDCVECIDFIQAVSKFLIQDEVITSIEGHLKRDVCEVDFTETVESCIEGVERWTKPMFVGGLDCSMCIGDFGSRFCYHYGICRPSFSEMYNDIQQVSTYQGMYNLAIQIQDPKYFFNFLVSTIGFRNECR